MVSWLQKARQRVSKKKFFHLHMISDSTGETLATIGRAAAAQYAKWQPTEHVSPMVKSLDDLETALNKVVVNPGIVLYTLVDNALERQLIIRCQAIGVPFQNVLKPVTRVFDSYLDDSMSGLSGAQHALDDDYFGRLDAITFAMTHDDGNLPDNIELADVILIGISRTSKTPTSIYLGQRGIKTTNLPLVLGMELPTALLSAKRPMVVALVASAERVLQVRENRLLAFDRELVGNAYVDKATIVEELSWTRQLCEANNWPMIDVSRRSIEETAAAIQALLKNRPSPYSENEDI